MSEIFGMHMTHKSLSAMCWMCFMVAMPCWIDVHECFASDKAFSDGDYDGSVIEKAAQGKMFSDLDCSRLWKVGNEPDICASIKDKYLILDKGDIDGHLGLIRILGYGMKRRWTIPFYSSDTNVQDPCVQALKELFAGVSEGQAIERRRILFLLSPLLEEEEILLMVTDVASLRPNISDDMKAMLEQARLVESDRAYLEYARTSWRKYVLQWRRSRCEIVYCLLACGTKSSIETAIGQIDQCIQDNEDPTWSAIGDGLMTLRLIEDVFEQVLSIRLQVSHARRDAMYRGGKEDIEKYRTLVVPILKRESDLMGFDCLGEKSLQNLKEQYPDVERRFLPKLCLFYFGIEPRLHNYKCGRLQHAASDVVFDWFGANLETIVFDHERGLWVVPDGFPYRDVIHVFDEEWGAEHKMEEHKTLKPTKTHPKATR